MQLRDFFDRSAVALDLQGTSKDEILREMVKLLGLDEKSDAILVKMLKRRENLGSTGIGRGIAIPHCRSVVVDRLRVAYGRRIGGVEYGAIDELPVYNLFLIVAPPMEVSNLYLPVLGRLAQFARTPDISQKLREVRTPDEFLDLIDTAAG
jgi:nitrogen PTS system EIIA component